MKRFIYPEEDDYEEYEGIYDKCEYCDALINFDALNDEDVIMSNGGMVEYWGARVHGPEYVEGFVCPCCGHRNNF